jgi:hypothetical protein
MTTGIQQRTPMNGHYQRKHKSPHPTVVGPRTTLPTAEILTGAPAELLADLETWHELAAAERQQARLAAEANAAAEAATADYRAKVRNAMSKGADPTKIKDRTEEHKARAVAHIGFHNDARNEREKLGHRLGLMLEDAAPDLYPIVEDRIDQSAATVRGSLASVREAWASYSEAFELRRWLSHIELDGNTVGAYHGASSLPRDVVTALATLEHAIAELDRLKADEAEVRAFRETA